LGRPPSVHSFASPSRLAPQVQAEMDSSIASSQAALSSSSSSSSRSSPVLGKEFLGRPPPIRFREGDHSHRHRAWPRECEPRWTQASLRCERRQAPRRRRRRQDCCPFWGKNSWDGRRRSDRPCCHCAWPRKGEPGWTCALLRRERQCRWHRAPRHRRRLRRTPPPPRRDRQIRRPPG